jgi:alkyl hydroperoxide reductase subunit AhpC
MDDTKHLDRARLRIINLEQERDELRRDIQELIAIVSAAQSEICSHLCPSVWETGAERPHSPLCKTMRSTLQKAMKLEGGTP